MTQNSSSAASALKFTSFNDAQGFFGALPILSTEDREAYLSLDQAVWEARSPQDFIEVIWVNDITYYLWEVFRLRRMKLHLISAGRFESAKVLLQQITGETFTIQFWKNWVAGEMESAEVVTSLLEHSGLSDEAITAKSAEKIIDILEKLERQSTQLEARRLATLRESEFYRENAELRRARRAQSRQLKGKSQGISVTVKDKNSGGPPKLNLSFDSSQ